MKENPQTPPQEHWSDEALKAGAAARELSQTGGKSDVPLVNQPQDDATIVAPLTTDRLWSSARWTQEFTPAELDAARNRVGQILSTPTIES